MGVRLGTGILLACLSLALAQSNSGQSPVLTVEKVTTEDVKRFLDPTIMINGVGYSFQANFLPRGAKLYSLT